MPRLEPEIARLLTAPEDSAVITAALEMHRAGIAVFPLAPAKKAPLFPNVHAGEKGPKCTGQCGLVGHGAHDGTHDEDKIRRWWTDHSTAGIGGSMLQLVAFDLDLQHGGQLLDALPETRTHYSGRGNGNRHLIYTFAPGSLASRITQRNGWVEGIDVKAGRGAYLVLPPTLHEETGQPYTVGDENGGEFHVLTDDEVRAIAEEAGKELPGTTERKKTPATGSERPSRESEGASGMFARSEAVKFLLDPPERGQGLTNDALSKVAGYYVRLYREDRALYELHVRDWVAKIDPAYEDTQKTVDSIWETEHSKEGERDRRIEEQLEHLRIRGIADQMYREERRRDSEEAGHLAEGGEFVLDVPEVASVWGYGAQVGWMRGEALILAGPNGVGKSTLAAQLVRARLAGGKVLGLPVEATSSKVLYLAMDRPAQIRRLLNVYLGGIDREVLNERLVVWKGPPPADLAAQPETLLELAKQAGADTVVVDSLKDAAVGLSSDEVGAAYNRARQIALNAGVEVLELHHMVKKGDNGSKPDRLEDVYGSVWITAGAGSVVLLWGSAGDTLVELTHLKQPIDPLGPWQVFHDREHAVSRVYRKRDALAILAALSNSGLTTANAVAVELFDSEKPEEGEKQKVRRKLEDFEARGWAKRHIGAVKLRGQKPSDGWETTAAGRKRADEDSFDSDAGGDEGALFEQL